MASHDLTLAHEWVPALDGEPAIYRLTLRNDGDTALSDFRLGFSGPILISEDAPLANGRIVRQLSNYCEIASDSGLVLGPGETWTIDIRNLDFPIRHWTDGIGGAFVVDATEDAHAVRVLPIRHARLNAPLLRGTVRLEGEADDGLAIIPWPREVDVEGRRTPPDGLAPVAESTAARAAAEAFARLTTLLYPGEGLVRPEHAGGMPVRLELRPGRGEGYAIAFAADGATVTAETQTGFMHGLVTLGQILRGARTEPGRFRFPAEGRIGDAPAMGFRGCHLDVARRFYGVAEIERFLAILAWNRLNVFHWHLSDDEAFRPEIAGLPQLGEAAWRGHELTLPPLLGSGPERSGGLYSVAEMRGVVGLAAQWGIEVVPEIDMPGHCYALLTAMPELRDPVEAGAHKSIQNFPNNCLNPGVEAVYPVVETILGELGAVFPSRYLHIGGDEVPAAAWQGSPAAAALAQRLGVTGAAPLQAYFLGRVQRFLGDIGKVTGAWEEAAQGGGIDREGSYLLGWHTVEASRRLAAAGYRVVASPAQAYYLDMALNADWNEPGAAWAGSSSPEATYAFDPTAGWSDEERGRFMGVQACIWSEPRHDSGTFDRLVFPRLSAIAETAWTTPGRKDFRRFAAAANLMPNLYGQYA